MKTVFVILLIGLFCMPLKAVWAKDVEQQVNRMVYYAAPNREVFAVAVCETYAKAALPEYVKYEVLPHYGVEKRGDKIALIVNGQPQFLKGAAAQIMTMSQGSLICDATGVSEDGACVFTLTLAPGTKYEALPVKRRYSFEGSDKVIVTTFVALRVHNKKNPMKLVALDPGHGGSQDLGTTANNIYEKQANLDIALMTRDYLQASGYGVFMTRDQDIDLDLGERAEGPNLLGADIFVSIHNNAFDPTAFDAKAARMYKGTTVLYNSLAAQPAKDLAIAMNDALTDTLRTHEYPVQDRPGLAVLSSTWMPAVLAECTMFPNYGDAKLITDRVNRQKAARAIANSVSSYLEQSQPKFFLAPGALNAGVNSSANAANHNLAVSGGDWIYYCEVAGDTYGGSDSRIYRVRADGSGQVKGETYIVPFNQDSASGLCLLDSWLYYENWSDGQKIYRCSLQGDKKELVADVPARWLQRAGIWLIYAKSEVKTTRVKDNGLYKRSLITGEETRLADGGVENVCADGGYVYYLAAEDGYRLYRVSTNGGIPEKIIDNECASFSVAGGMIYYVNHEDGNRVYSATISGKEQRALMLQPAIGYINAADSQVLYFTRLDKDGLWRLNLQDGTIDTVTRIAGGPINVLGTLVFYRTMFFNDGRQ